MIEQEGRVLSLDGDSAEITIVRQSACGGCQAKSGCGTAVVGSLFPSRELKLRLPNTAHARAGDRVVVGLPEAALQVAALMLYGLPLVAMLVAAIAGQTLAQSSGWQGEPAAILGGLSGLIGGLLITRRLSHLGGMRPVILRRLPTHEVGLHSLNIQHGSSSET